MLRTILMIFGMLIAGSMAQSQVQYAQPRFDFDPNASWYERLKDFFSLDNVGQTTLGKVLAWKGDLIQPAALFGLSIFAVYTLIRIMLTLLSGFIDINTGIVGRVITAIGDLNKAFFNRLSGVPEDVATDEGRRRRAIIEVADQVYDAFNKYQF